MGDTVDLNGVHLTEIKEKINLKEETVKTVSIDDEINAIAAKPTLIMLLVGLWSMTWSAYGTFHAYICVFTGFIPYNEWECVATSTKCLELLSHEEVNRATLCDNELVVSTDFVWTTARTSFSMDWDIYCGNEYKLALSSSLYYVGAVIGLLSSTMLFEKLGRKRGALYMAVATLLVFFVQPFCQSFEMLIVLRILNGGTQCAAYMGIYIWVFEYMPNKFRPIYNTITMVLWALGYLIIVCVSYLIPQWQYICLALNLLGFIGIIPLFIFPESPRYLLNCGRIEETKKALEDFSRLSNDKRNYDNVDFVKDVEKTADELSVSDQLAQLKKYPVFLKETLLQIYAWVVISALFYGFNYSWSSFGKSLYESYVFAATGETIAYLGLIPLSYMCGRNSGLMLLMSGASVSFIIATISVEFGNDWTMERLASIIGTMFVSAAFGLVFLYTGELAPTTHRGFVMSSCSMLARIGAFAGPQISLIFSQVSREVPLVFFAILSAGVVLAMCFLPETKGLPIPETAPDVYQRDQNSEPFTVKVRQFVKRVTGSKAGSEDSSVVENTSAKC